MRGGALPAQAANSHAPMASKRVPIVPEDSSAARMPFPGATIAFAVAISSAATGVCIALAVFRGSVWCRVGWVSAFTEGSECSANARRSQFNSDPRGLGVDILRGVVRNLRERGA